MTTRKIKVAKMMATAQLIASSYPRLIVLTTAHENYIKVSVYITREDTEYNNPNFQLKMEEIAGEENKLIHTILPSDNEYWEIDF